MAAVMAKVVHEIHPKADTVIFLKNPLQDFAFKNRPDTKKLDAEASVLPANSPTEELFKEKSVVESSETEDSNKEPIEYHVSSIYLKLAPSHFERMLSREKWNEGISNAIDGRYHITVEEWDEEALLIVLNALHRRTQEVPRSPSIEMVAKIATIIEYYECMEGIELLLAETWIKNLQISTPVPMRPCRDLFLWIYIAWVFQLSSDFKHSTDTAIYYCKHDELTISDFPITRFTDKISQARVRAIDAIISGLNDLCNEFRSNKYHCPKGSQSFECGSMQYGALMKQMNSFGLLSPKLKDPFPALSVEKILDMMCTFKSPCFYTPDRVTHDTCGPGDRIQKIKDEVQESIKGLELTDFARL